MADKEHPIADYGIIGNCETAALINPDGGIDWLCLPAFDSASFFGAILDRQKAGEFFIRPENDYSLLRGYQENTAILETRFICDDGATVKLTDFFVIARKRDSRFYDFTSLHPTRKLVRLVEFESGESVEMRAGLTARPDYGREQPAWQPVSGGFECSETAVFSNLPLSLQDGDIGLSFTVRKGEPVFFVLDHAEQRRAPSLPELRQWLEITRAFWHEWNLFNYYRGPHQETVRRSAITLKLLTYAPTGAIIAAPTTSLPEKIGGDLNWDYRFTWVRDTALLINTLFRLGYSGEAKAYFEFLANDHEKRRKSGDHRLPVLVPIRDGTVVKEEKLHHLAGYGGSLPVRRGNRVEDQFQYDNQGHFLQSLYFWKHCGGKIDETKLDMAEHAIKFLREHWDQPDNGTWEPVERSHFTNSKAAAWTAFKRAHDLGLMSREEAGELCEKIHRQVMERGLRQREDGETYLASHYDTHEMDATCLPTFTSGFLAEDLARRTREEVDRRLGDGAWIYRAEGYRKQGEGAFVICGFWRIRHLIREGKFDLAEALLEKTVAAMNPLGLLSEEIDPATGNFLGNFPQGYSHLGLITTIIDLEKSKKDPEFARLTEHEKFIKSVGRTIGLRAVIEGFFRVPRTLRLLVSNRSKWPWS